MTFDELVKRCKASVHLEVNGHRDSYESVEQYFADRPDIGECIAVECVQRMIARDTVYSLQFYPDTPIGSYSVYGTSLNEVLEQAALILSGE